MYKHFARVLATIQGLLLFITMAHAQSAILDLPRASQRAVVTQRIGITDVSISYHRPLVNKRKIWGGVVPYGDVWRAGANEKIPPLHLPIRSASRERLCPREPMVCT